MRQVLCGDDCEPSVGIIDLVLEHRAFIGLVDGDHDRAELAQGEPKQDMFDPRGDHEKDPVSFPDAALRETLRPAIRLVLDVAIGQNALARDQERLFGSLPGARFEKIVEDPVGPPRQGGSHQWRFHFGRFGLCRGGDHD